MEGNEKFECGTTGSKNRPTKTSDVELLDTDYNITMLIIFK